MIITCDKCSTKFKLDESLLEKDGSRVRCSICRNIFTIYPPLQKKEKSIEQDEKQSVSPVPETFSDSGDSVEEKNDSALSHDGFESVDALDFDNDFGLDYDLTSGDDDKKTEEKDSALDNNLDFEDDFDLEGDLEFEDDFEDGLDLDKADDSEENIPDTGSKEENNQEKEEHELDLELDLDMEFEDEPPEIEAATKSDLDIEKTKEGQDESLDDKLDFSKSNKISEHDETLIQKETPEENILDNETDYIKETKQETSDENIQKYSSELTPKLTKNLDAINKEKNSEEFYPDDIEHDFKTTEDFKKPVKKPTKVGKPVFIVLIIAILILAGYSISIMEGINIPYISNIKIPFITQYFTSSHNTKIPVRLIPDKESINGRFVTNSSAGTLFVITGRVTNSSQIVCSHIKVTGTLITKGKIKAKSKTAFCGNLIAENKLVSLKMTAINTIMSRKAGNNNSNVRIAPGHSIPFMIVFSDLPENLKNFTVNVAGFDKEPVKK